MYDAPVRPETRRGMMPAMELTPLQADIIASQLAPHSRSALAIQVHDAVGSTNDIVRDLHEAGSCHGAAIFAEAQTAGRGRRGRAWHSPSGGNLYCSLGWHFNCPLDALSGLSLMVGAMLAKAIGQCCGVEVQLKWPNDLYFGERKLGGVLIELLGECEGGQAAVIGMGLNVAMPSPAAEMIDRPWTDLSKASGEIVDRNRLAVTVLEELVSGLPDVGSSVPHQWLDQWRRRDWLLGRSIVVEGLPPVAGIAAGIDESGALMLHTDTGHCTVAGGEVSILEIGARA